LQETAALVANVTNTESAKNLRQAALGAVMPFGSAFGHPVPMIYKVVAETTPDCDCADCRAGRHLYSLFCWRDGQWMHVGFSLQSYTSPEDCMKNHWWGVQFEPDDVWEDGSPVVPPEPTLAADMESQRMVTVDGEAPARSLDSMRKHLIKPAGD
jgi:hypothetical protein